MPDRGTPIAAPRGGRDLMPAVYDELRRLARSLLRRLHPGHTLQPTALVHEAFLRVIGKRDPGWDNRRHFFAATANAMRHILVDQARRRASEKHGGGLQRIDLHDGLVLVEPPADKLLALHESLLHMQEVEPRLAEIVTLRYFSGLSVAEVAQVLGESERTVYRDWRRSRAWLGRALERLPDGRLPAERLAQTSEG